MRHAFIVVATLVTFTAFLFGISGCGSDMESSESSPNTAREPKIPVSGGPADVVRKACEEHEGILTIASNENDGYTMDFIVVCRDQTVRVVDAYDY